MVCSIKETETWRVQLSGVVFGKVGVQLCTHKLNFAFGYSTSQVHTVLFLKDMQYGLKFSESKVLLTFTLFTSVFPKVDTDVKRSS